MKRAHSDKNQPSVRPRVPGHSTAPFIRNQASFRNRSESDDKAIIRNNNLQLSFSEDQINPESPLSFEARGGQFRPHSAGLNHHQTSWHSAMSGFAFGSRQFISYPRFFQPRFQNAFNYYSRSNPQRIPSTTRQFQETQRYWNARFTQQHNGMHTSAISASGTRNKGHKAKAHLDKNKVFMRRKWQALPEADQCRSDEFSFSIVTYNMLSDSLLYENMFLYEDCNYDDLSWGYRKEKLLAELLGYDAEILCLQEVDACHYENWFRPKLHEAGYMGLFVQRTGGKPDGCAIFFRHAKFTLVNYKLVQYYTPMVQVLDKDNVGIVLLLQANTPEAENPFICIANTHLLFNKKRGDIKLAQLAYLFAQINDLAVLSQDDHRKTHCPVILCGDLNSLPYSPLYHFLITGQLDYSSRSPAVISGQLASSEARSGPSSRRICTPLLPWEFGVTADCQWREQRKDKSEGSCSHTQDRPTSCQHRQTGHVQDSERSVTSDCQWWEQREGDSTGSCTNNQDRQPTLQDSNRQTSDTQDSGIHTEQRKNAEDHNNPSQRCESNRSMQAHSYRNENLKHVDSDTFSGFKTSTNTNRRAGSTEVNDSKIDKDSVRQWNKELREREVKTTGTSKIDGFKRNSRFDRNTEHIEHSERSRVSNSNRYTEQPQRRLDHVQRYSQGDEHFTMNPLGESDRTTDRQSKRNSEIIDLTGDSGSPSAHNIMAEPNRDRKSNRSAFEDSELFENMKSNLTRDPDRTTGRQSKRNSEVVDLREVTNSPNPRNRMAESNRAGDSSRNLDFNESTGQTSNAREQHPDTPLSTTSSRHTDCQTEKSKYNKSGNISIPWQFTSVYTHRFPDGTPEVTTCHSKACCNVDYILYTAGTRDRRSTEHKKHVQMGKLTLLGRLELMGKSDFNTMRLLPNRIFPSDHLSLQARFKLT